VAHQELSANPDALPGADPPRIHRCHVTGTSLHVEVRGSGPALLLVHGGGEDAEVWRGVAERLADFTVVTYDRRGTLRSGRDGWPGAGSVQHADDAAAVLEALALDRAVVFGGSSAGIVALQLALRHPGLIRRALVFEPGLFRHVSGSEVLQDAVRQAIDDHLAAHPDDWTGALGAFRRAVATAMGNDTFLAPPMGREWYALREEVDAEAFVRDDLPILTEEVVDEDALASATVDLRFLFGTGSMPVFRQIAINLATLRGSHAIAIGGVGHLVYYQPDTAAAQIRAHAQTASSTVAAFVQSDTTPASRAGRGPFFPVPGRRRRL
jgi:pimeloyl-ACP methyl ester carboxylesterase